MFIKCHHKLSRRLNVHTKHTQSLISPHINYAHMWSQNIPAIFPCVFCMFIYQEVHHLHFHLKSALALTHHPLVWEECVDDWHQVSEQCQAQQRWKQLVHDVLIETQTRRIGLVIRNKNLHWGHTKGEWERPMSSLSAWNLCSSVIKTQWHNRTLTDVGKGESWEHRPLLKSQCDANHCAHSFNNAHLLLIPARRTVEGLPTRENLCIISMQNCARNTMIISEVNSVYIHTFIKHFISTHLFIIIPRHMKEPAHIPKTWAVFTKVVPAILGKQTVHRIQRFLHRLLGHSTVAP